MKARSRREIIDENKSLRKQLSQEKANTREAVYKANKEVEKANERLRRAGLSGRYEYAGRMARGTVETIDMVCGNCGTGVNNEDDFCRKCGARFRERYDI